MNLRRQGGRSTKVRHLASDVEGELGGASSWQRFVEVLVSLSHSEHTTAHRTRLSRSNVTPDRSSRATLKAQVQLGDREVAEYGQAG